MLNEVNMLSYSADYHVRVHCLNRLATAEITTFNSNKCTKLR